MLCPVLRQGFGGKFGVESDRQDKSAHGFGDGEGERVGTNYQPTKPDRGELPLDSVAGISV